MPTPDRGLLNKLIRRAAEAAGLPVERDWQASVLFVGGRSMAKANADYVGHQGETDVITFSYFDDPESLFPGDVAVELLICIDVALKEGTQREDSSYAEEMTLYILHGFLHSAGYDDLTPEARRGMRRGERRGMEILRKEFDLNKVFNVQT
ncbi:MAG: rRNA maturation RNase YbeY [Lentisphaeria bacterium]|nr:rRNA maturation RNase YbeY [Lentisphaeria bacterium]